MPRAIARHPHASRLDILLVLLVLLGVLFVFQLKGQILKFDALTLFSPYFSLVSDFSRSGELLLWNPWSNCGSPDTAYVEMGSFSPLTILLALVTGGGRLGFLLYWLTIWGIGGVGMVLLGRHLQAPVWARIAVSLSFMFCGFYLGNATHTSWLYGFSFLPLMIWRLDVAIMHRRRWPAVEAGAMFGLSALAGHPALVILNGLFLGVWAVGRGVTQAEAGRAKRLVHVVVVLALMLVIALVVLCPAYVSFFADGAGFSDRVQGLDRSRAIADHALPLNALSTLTSPWLPVLGLENPHLWNGTFIGLVSNYMGALVPALALLALVLCPKNRFRWWIFVAGLLFMACALGPELPLRGWLYDVFIPSRYFRHTSVMRVYFLLSLSILALMGSRSLCEPGAAAKGWRRFLFCSLAVSVAAVTGHMIMVRSIAQLGEEAGLARLHVFLAWASVPLVAALGWYAREALRATLIPSLVVLVVVLDCGMSLYLSRVMICVADDHSERLAAMRSRSIGLMPTGLARFRTPRGAYGVAFNLLSKTPLLENFNQLSNRFHSRSSMTPLATSWVDEEELSRSALHRDRRIWFSSEAARSDVSDACFMAFVRRTRQLGSMPLVYHERDDMVHMPIRGEPGNNDSGEVAQIEELPPAVSLPVALIEYTPTAMTFEVDCETDGWLVVTDRWARGWQARVDGTPATVYGGCFIFRALRVSAGTHRVELAYEPAGHPWLVILSWGCLVVVVAGSFIRSRHKVANLEVRPETLSRLQIANEAQSAVPEVLEVVRLRLRPSGTTSRTSSQFSLREGFPAGPLDS